MSCFKWVENTWLRSARDAKCFQIEVDQDEDEDVMGPPFMDKVKDMSGTVVPCLGFVMSSDGREGLLSALRAGIRHVQISCSSGNEEKEFSAALDMTSALKRDELFVSLRVEATEGFLDTCVADLKSSLKNFKLSYVDLLLLSADGLDDLKYAWQGIEKCAELGLAREVGLCNVLKSQDLQLLHIDAKKKPKYLQLVLTPENAEEMIAHCKQLDCTVAAHCSWSFMKELGATQPFTDAAHYLHLRSNIIVMAWLLENGCAVLLENFNGEEIHELVEWARHPVSLGALKFK